MSTHKQRLRLSWDEEHNGLRADLPGVEISEGQSRGTLPFLIHNIYLTHQQQLNVRNDYQCQHFFGSCRHETIINMY